MAWDMPRYHLHFYHQGHVIWDHTGFDLPGLGEAVRAEAVPVNEAWSDVLLTIREDQQAAIITDETGRILLVMNG